MYLETDGMMEEGPLAGDAAPPLPVWNMAALALQRCSLGSKVQQYAI